MAWLWGAAGDGFALAHVALMVLLVVGGPMALRWRGVLRVHLPALVATAAVFVAGADCPLTVWQKACIRRSGSTPYDGGFIEHHLIEPLTGGGVTLFTTLVTVAGWAVPTLWSYAALLRRRGGDGIGGRTLA